MREHPKAVRVLIFLGGGGGGGVALYLSPGATGWNIWQLSDMLTPGRYVLSAMAMATVLTYQST